MPIFSFLGGHIFLRFTIVNAIGSKTRVFEETKSDRGLQRQFQVAQEEWSYQLCNALCYYFPFHSADSIWLLSSAEPSETFPE